MNDPIKHLPGISAGRLTTTRLDSFLLTAGPDQGEPVIFLHGNLSSSTFWEESMLSLPHRWRAIAPDLRGYALSDSTAVIDATRGISDWLDDLLALADRLGHERFHLVAHSLGGCVAWGALGAVPQRLASVTLVSPGPPCCFGGAKGPGGELVHDDGAGSGAGLVHREFVERLDERERDNDDDFFSPRAVMRRLYWKPPFRPAREEDLMTAMLQVHRGPRQFPGDQLASPHWPGFAPGRFGPINAISPIYNQWVLPRLIAASEKPPVLWIYGEDDAIVSDSSASDAGCQGQMGFRPGWPGADVFPPQPLVTQVMHALSTYEATGGSVTRAGLPHVGHSPFLEAAEQFQALLHTHLLSSDDH